MEAGEPLPSPKSWRGPEFEEVEDDVCFGAAAGVEFVDSMRVDRLRATPKGRAVLQAFAACSECDEDESHMGGEHGELIEALASDNCPPRLHVVRATSPFNPVALFTPPTEAALCAVAAERIRPGSPIALYLGDLSLAEDAACGGAGNTYLYELSPAELEKRGFHGARLVVDARRCGGEARFINDKWAPGGLPPRKPNCFVELVFDGHAKEFLLVVFASARIRKGEEVIVDYGPDYWQVAAKALLDAHSEVNGSGVVK